MLERVLSDCSGNPQQPAELDLPKHGDYAESPVLPPITPMPLVRLSEPFDHEGFIFELKHDGFRGLAYIDGHHCELISRRKHVYKSWPYLCTELAHPIDVIKRLLTAGSSFWVRWPQPIQDLLFRREWPYFAVFEPLWLGGEDLRSMPLVARKRRLKASLALSENVSSRMLAAGINSTLMAVENLTVGSTVGCRLRA